MTAYKQHIAILLKQLLLVFVMYFVCRLAFLLFNQAYFSNLTIVDAIKIFFWGIRFDAFSIAVSNALFILISVLPFTFATHRFIKKSNYFLFIFFNGLFLLTNCIDIGYFPFNKKSSTFDIINQLFAGQTDVTSLLPSFLADYWYVVLFYLVLMFIFINLSSKLSKQEPTLTGHYSLMDSLKITGIAITILSVTFISFRGLARVPIQLIDAGKYATAKYVDVLINTPLSILLTMDKTNLEEIHEVTEEEITKIIQPIKQFNHSNFSKKNVMIIILESFSKEYTGLSKRPSYTPFLDSLMKQAVVFNQAISNSATSIEGIPAILSSLPNLMPNPYINSTYSSNRLTSIASLLKEEGYETSFFHGGTNGTMNFDGYSNLSGFENYYGRKEYNNETDFDGNWGIWDEPFLQYTAETLNKTKQPFLATVFTLSSHHPFKVPSNYQHKFPKGKLEIHESIGYADYALSRFFEKAKTMSWFKNTLFVISPDHTSISNDEFYRNDVGQHQIPIIFYDPTNLKPTLNHQLIQQIDIMPSIMDYLGYSKPFFSFGNSVWGANSSKYAIHYHSGNYFLTNDSLYFVFNNLQLQQVYRYKTDSLLTKNIYLPLKNNYTETQTFLKAFVQHYNKAIINNKTN